jgi:polysaccharide biosynthesis transport protein
MRALLSVPPLAAIPVIVTRADSRKRRRVKTLSWVGSVAGLVALMSVVHFYVRPLDVVWISLLRRFGI